MLILINLLIPLFLTNRGRHRSRSRSPARHHRSRSPAHRRERSRGRSCVCHDDRHRRRSHSPRHRSYSRDRDQRSHSRHRHHRRSRDHQDDRCRRSHSRSHSRSRSRSAYTSRSRSLRDRDRGRRDEDRRRSRSNRRRHNKGEPFTNLALFILSLLGKTPHTTRTQALAHTQSAFVILLLSSALSPSGQHRSLSHTCRLAHTAFKRFYRLRANTSPNSPHHLHPMTARAALPTRRAPPPHSISYGHSCRTRYP